MATGLPPSEPILKTLGRVVPAIAGAVIEGQKRGEIRAGDPVLFTISTFAQPVHLYLARGAIGAVTGINLDEAHNRIADHAVAVVRAALEQR